MAFIRTIDPNESRGDVRAMYERQQASWGYVPNYAKIFSHRPEVMARWASLLAGIRKTIEPRRFELVTLAAAYELKNSACALAHGKALTRWLSPADVAALLDDEAPSPLSEGDVIMVRFARKVARDASAITAGDVEALKVAGFDDGEIFDIVATVAGRAFFTKLLDGLGIEPDRPFGDIDESLRRRLTVGRPIDYRAPTHMEEPVTRSAVSHMLEMHRLRRSFTRHLLRRMTGFVARMVRAWQAAVLTPRLHLPRVRTKRA